MIFKISKTYATPDFKYSDGLFEMKGRCHPISPNIFYTQLLSFVESYTKSPKKNTKIIINLEYLNSNSNRVLLSILKKFNNIFDKGYEVYLNWYYEGSDDAIYDLGTIFKTMVHFPFNLIDNKEVK